MEQSKILKISDLVEDLTAPRWVEYPAIPGVKVLLRMPDIPESTKLVAKASQPDGQGGFTIDWVEFHDLLMRYALVDWEGLKVKHLVVFFPGHKLIIEDPQAGTPAPLGEAELAYCAENRDFLLSQSSGFFNWLHQAVREWDEKLRAQEEADKENLSATPNTTPTPSA